MMFRLAFPSPPVLIYVGLTLFHEFHILRYDGEMLPYMNNFAETFYPLLLLLPRIEVVDGSLTVVQEVIIDVFNFLENCLPAKVPGVFFDGPSRQRWLSLSKNNRLFKGCP